MRTSADSLREQAARFFAMAEAARNEGNPDLADLLTEAARRAIGAEASGPIQEKQSAVAGVQANKFSTRVMTTTHRLLSNLTHGG